MTTAVASVASSVLANPVVASPPIGVAGPHPDAALLELGARFEAAQAAHRAAEAKWGECHDAFEAFVAARAPEVLRWRWAVDKGMPFTMTRATWHEGDLYRDDEVEQMRARRWDGVARYTSGVTGKKTQARVDRVVAASDRWRPTRDKKCLQLRMAEVEAAVDAPRASATALAAEIDTVPAPQTIDGLAVKASVALYLMWIGEGGEWLQLEELADAVVQVAGAARG